MAAIAPSRPPGALAQQAIRRRVATAALLGALTLALLLAVPGLQPVVRQIGSIDPAWIVAAVALELASSVSFVVVFRAFFDRIPGRDARALAWTSMASGVLLPGGGVGGLAIGGWLMRLTGAPTRWIVRRSSGLFFFTSAINVTAVVGAGLLLLAGAPGPHDFERAGLPVLGGVAATLVVLALARPGAEPARGRRLGGVAAGIGDARRALLRPGWRLLGAIGYLGFDIAVLWTAFSAIGDAPPVAALMLGYSIGYIANALPIPGGFGVLDAGLAGALLAYGAEPEHVAAAVLVYHAIAVWVPSLGGLLAYARLRGRLAAPAPSSLE
jgi:uncharacterized membrane protein YbhN (UPF0104 family)